MINATELKNGTTFLHYRKPYQVIKYTHIKIGRGGALVKVNVRNLETGSVDNFSFSAELTFDEADTQKRKLQYLYADKLVVVFMDPKTFEQVEIPLAVLGSQIKFAKEFSFKGTLHVCHVSSSESVNLINSEEDIKITCAVTPHHILWDNSMLGREDGLLYKMNPPLREREEVNSLKNDLLKGKINWIETDHASHAIGEKLFSPYMSGFPSLYLYKKFIEEYLPELGLSSEQINKLTYDNIVEVFKI